MTGVALAWRGGFRSAEVNALHAEAFGTRVFSDAESDWETVVLGHSLGWVTARLDDELVGFVNVPWDGSVHAVVQDVCVTASARHRGVGVRMVHLARDEARAAGCEWLHVDFDAALAPFYYAACGFRPTHAGLIDLT